LITPDLRSTRHVGVVLGLTIPALLAIALAGGCPMTDWYAPRMPPRAYRSAALGSVIADLERENVIPSGTTWESPDLKSLPVNMTSYLLPTARDAVHEVALRAGVIIGYPMGQEGQVTGPLHIRAASESPPGVEPHEAALPSIEDVHAIYTACLEERLKSGNEDVGGEYLVVQNTTIVFCKDPGSWSDVQSDDIRRASTGAGIPEELVFDLLEGESPKPVPGLPNSNPVTSAALSRIFSGKGWWPDFYRLYPGSAGIVRFSEPVFSADGSRALVYVAHSCGGLCGTGWLVLLRRDGTSWRIEVQKMLWIS
jgi:hypothetical protein